MLLFVIFNLSVAVEMEQPSDIEGVRVTQLLLKVMLLDKIDRDRAAIVAFRTNYMNSPNLTSTTRSAMAMATLRLPRATRSKCTLLTNQ